MILSFNLQDTSRTSPEAPGLHIFQCPVCFAIKTAGGACFCVKDGVVMKCVDNLPVSRFMVKKIEGKWKTT